MEDILFSLPKYLTKETITVVGFIATAWIGWKVAAKTFGLISAAAVKFSFVGLTAAVMFMTGIGGLGWSIGDLASRLEPSTENKIGLDNSDLKSLAEHDANTVQGILDYAKVRDSSTTEIKAQTLADMVTMANDQNREAIVEYLKLLQKRETDKSTLANYEGHTPVTLAHYSAMQMKPSNESLQLLKSDNTSLKPEKKYTPIQATWTAFFGGIGAMILSMVVWNNRPNKYA